MAIMAVVMVLFVLPPDVFSSLLAGLSRVPGGARAAVGIRRAASSLGLGDGEPGFLGRSALRHARGQGRAHCRLGSVFPRGRLGYGNGDSLTMVRGSLADAAAGGANWAPRSKAERRSTAS